MLTKEIQELTQEDIDTHGFLLFDFEKDAFGYLEIEMDGTCLELVEVIIGEELENHHLVRLPNSSRTFLTASFVLKNGHHVYQFPIPDFRSAYGINTCQPLCPECKGRAIAPFRYVEIHHCYGKVTVRRTAFFRKFDLNSSRCEMPNNPWLSQLWEFCRHTVRATSVFPCYVDGERERLPYEADAYIGQLGHFCVAADYGLAKNSLNYFFAHGDRTWPTEWHLQVPLMVRDYLYYSGDQKSVNKWLPRLEEKLLPQLCQKDELIRHVPGIRIRDIVDWPETDRDHYEFGEANFVPNAFRVESAKACYDLTKDKKYLQLAKKIRKSLREKLYSPQGLPVDTIGSSHTSLHTATCALLFGIFEGEKEKEELKKILLKKQNHCSVYFVQFLLEACFQFGLDQLGMDILNGEGIRSWKNMIRKGATITMEAWDNTFKPGQDWTHVWGAAPGNIIPRWVCGIRPTAPGFKKYVVTPSPLSGDFTYQQPTPNGFLLVQKQKGKVSILPQK